MRGRYTPRTWAILGQRWARNIPNLSQPNNRGGGGPLLQLCVPQRRREAARRPGRWENHRHHPGVPWRWHGERLPLGPIGIPPHKPLEPLARLVYTTRAIQPSCRDRFGKHGLRETGTLILQLTQHGDRLLGEDTVVTSAEFRPHYRLLSNSHHVLNLVRAARLCRLPSKNLVGLTDVVVNIPPVATHGELHASLARLSIQSYSSAHGVRRITNTQQVASIVVIASRELWWWGWVNSAVAFSVCRSGSHTWPLSRVMVVLPSKGRERKTTHLPIFPKHRHIRRHGHGVRCARRHARQVERPKREA